MKLLAICPCEKVIFDKRDVPSLITLIQNIELGMNQADGTSADIPRNAVFPKEWFIYTRWQSFDEDVGKNFEQVFQVFWPDGEKFVEQRVTLKPIVKDDDIQQSSLQLGGLPGGQVGLVDILTWLDSEGSRVTDIAKCSVRIKHIPAQSANDPNLVTH